ncbi:MAG: acyl-CoA dehydrogenase family protein, partial [Rhodospirillales bacterium]|nr:acyl-CoA dehydrogenase family protein [Rhodospirillales bacterium]
VRAWLADNLDPEIRHHTLRQMPDKLVPWHRKLYEKGWIAPHWPKEYGGMGASLAEQIILTEEMGHAGAPELCTEHGINHLGPILIEMGSEDQKKRFLPPILSGDVIWAEGYSEPNSGSDLASLKMRAELVGDEFILNGQKIWTTNGHYADWMFALVRSDAGAKPKQAGITFLLIDLKSPGITIRPIRSIIGDAEFAEEFFDDVRVPI